MKKSTVIIILIVYLASIVVVGFFGMKVKVYDKIKYVQSIEMSAQAESADMYEFESLGIDPTTKNHKYALYIYFTEHHILDDEARPYLPIILMPQVTYDTGDIAGENEKIEYKLISRIDYEGQGKLALSRTGVLECYDSMMFFSILVQPVQSALVGSSAQIEVYVI